uniref:Integrase catalytic domain-containing protein n=1 Tax=Bracon brevicornis TaxID=1563983 RepID=A0A6V7II30_9HYME
MLWHVKYGHASVAYLKTLRAKFSGNKKLSKAQFDESIPDCEVCKIAQFNKLPFPSTKNRATKPLRIIHSDTRGAINRSFHPKGDCFISVSVDDYSRFAMAYPMRAKTDTGRCFEMFIRSARDSLGCDARVRYLRSDRGTEYTSGYTVVVLRELLADSRLSSPDTPGHNGAAERINETLQKKIR